MPRDDALVKSLGLDCEDKSHAEHLLLSQWPCCSMKEVIHCLAVKNSMSMCITHCHMMHGMRLL